MGTFLGFGLTAQGFLGEEGAGAGAVPVPWCDFWDTPQGRGCSCRAESGAAVVQGAKSVYLEWKGSGSAYMEPPEEADRPFRMTLLGVLPAPSVTGRLFSLPLAPKREGG